MKYNDVLIRRTPILMAIQLTKWYTVKPIMMLTLKIHTMKLSIRLTVITFCFAMIGHAQNAKEAVQNTKQIREGKKNLERDTKELEALMVKLNTFNGSFDKRNAEKLNSLKANIIFGYG